MRHTFLGGVHPKEKKSMSRDSELRIFNPTGELVFPLAQHIGKPAIPVIKKGDAVSAGQLIAEADGFVSANIYSSCSGTVKALERRRTVSGDMLDCIVIDNDGQFTTAEGVGEPRDASQMTNEEIIECVKWAGIVGLGGAGFPTHVKLQPKEPEAVKYVIANGAECEPYLTCNDQLMRAQAEAIVAGLRLVLRLFPNAEGVICIERNKPEAIAAMKAAAGEGISVLPLTTKYPQGGEHSLIQCVTGIDYPVAMLPAEVGCIVLNVGTLYAIERAVCHTEPLFTHVLTVSGVVNTPTNFIVRDGTSFAELIEAAGGVKAKGVRKVICGGPMMGLAVGTTEVPVQKTTNGITLFSFDPVQQAEEQKTACLRCGRCTTVCPMGLLPQLMAEAAEHGYYERYEKQLYGLECISCGSCSYICPSKRVLTQVFKQMKTEILAQKRAAQAGGAT